MTSLLLVTSVYFLVLLNFLDFLYLNILLLLLLFSSYLIISLQEFESFLFGGSSILIDCILWVLLRSFLTDLFLLLSNPFLLFLLLIFFFLSNILILLILFSYLFFFFINIFFVFFLNDFIILKI